MRRRPIATSGLLGILLGLFMFPSVPAQAGCIQRTYHVQAFPGNALGRGVRVSGPGMLVENGNVSCVRVSSIGVVDSSDNFVEIGWFEDPGGELAGSCDVTSGPPKLLVFALANGFPRCKDSTRDLNPGFENFWVQDVDQNTEWRYYLNGDHVETLNTPFTNGRPTNNGERKTLGDSARAEFDGLKRMNSSNDWVNWALTYIPVDTDPDYRGCWRSNVHTEVQINPC
jgi:hypothetical protein